MVVDPGRCVVEKMIRPSAATTTGSNNTPAGTPRSFRADTYGGPRRRDASTSPNRPGTHLGGYWPRARARRIWSLRLRLPLGQKASENG